MNLSALTVKQLNLYVRSLLEGDPRLASVLVQGEISNFKNHYASGHFYFTLKDNDASIRCVMFRTNASRLKFEFQDGMQVILRGRVSVYEKDGQYQFYCEEAYPSGIGDIAMQFEQTKAKLEAEGLFNADNKRPLPKFPKCIAVVTSDTGAAVQDILNILSRRWDLAEIILCPVSVQGENAVPEMMDALERLYNLNRADVIIIGRGGGSKEDLWAFNSEILARKIYESPVPVISAVGHETDFTICDFVADLRAPTPSAAAELAVADKTDISNRLENYKTSLSNSLIAKYALNKTKLEVVLNSQAFKNPQDFFINKRYIQLDRFEEALKRNANLKVNNLKLKTLSLAERLDNLSPLKVMARGFTVTQKQGKTVNSVKYLNVGDKLELTFSDGKANATITEIFKEN
ncbi:MAG: exodeoxyribonuclease VII large subunit [Clostridia bacterium]|nr:exodeoxyribonuclease VII large subunit [Clostridia bacterium]